MESNSSMDEDNPQQKKLKLLCECDPIDHTQNPSFPIVTLTDDVIEHIISLLPIKLASQTSILSKRFEKSWQNSIYLCFNFLFSRNYSQSEIADIVHRVITGHSNKKIETFQLCLDSNNLEDLIQIWLRIVLLKNPKVVDLDFLMGRPYAGPFVVPFELFDVESIQHLRFAYCALNFPTKFKDLHFLRSLVLRLVNLKPTFVKTVIDNCSLLESMDIVKCYGIRHFKVYASALKFFKVLKIADCYQLDSAFVDAPTLSVFHFIGKPRNMNFNDRMLELRDVMFNFAIVPYAVPKNRMEKLMPYISHVRVLTITSTLLEYLCSNLDQVKIKGPKPYLWHLKELQLLMETTSFLNPYDIINFVDKCPVLERLFFDMQSFAFDETCQLWLWNDKEKFEQYDKQLPFLKLVKVSNFKFSEIELQLLRFFLEKAINLETLAIFSMKKYRLNKKNSPTIVDLLHLFNSWKTSPSAKVNVYKYRHKEDGEILPAHQDFIKYYPYY